MININETAYHEAGHAVTGYFFYPPVTATIIPSDKESGRRYLGSTKCNLVDPIFFDPPDNELFFRLYLHYFLHIWSGEYFQKKISEQIDEKGLNVDKEFLEFISDPNVLYCFEFFKSKITTLFFSYKTVNLMVDELAGELIKKETLCNEEIMNILSSYNFDYEKQIELIMDEYYLPICRKYNEMKESNTILKP